MVKRQAESSVTVGPEGVILTPFANEICLQEDLEVSLVSLPVTVGDIRFPMCLVAASVGRHKAVRPRTDGFPGWPLHLVPCAMMQCSVEMPSGHMLFPFADSPHITQEGFIIHGSNPETPAKVYRLLLHREIISNPREAAREVLVHLQWTRQEDTPLQVFPFRALQHLEHWPTSPPAKRRAALWLTHSQKVHSCRVPRLNFRYISDPLMDEHASLQRKSARQTGANPPCPPPITMVV